jgi:folate-binding protein YgfZ
MTAPRQALLTDRGVVAVTGEDAEKLLQGLVTNNVAGLAPGCLVFAGLLSPQGKILSDFVMQRSGDGFLLDVAQDRAADLAKRLTLYRLRSKVDIEDRSQDFAVVAAWGAEPDAGMGLRDPRLAALGTREIVEAGAAPAHGSHTDAEAAYHTHRIALGVPEGGRDYAYGDAFPHEALYDQLNGVSFDKGCYVGQEIVSRMEHRGTARKRIVMIEGAVELPDSGSDVKAGDVVIGILGSTAGRRGLALVRLDRAGEFIAKGIPLKAGDVAVTLHKPPFAAFSMEPPSQPGPAP